MNGIQHTLAPMARSRAPDSRGVTAPLSRGGSPPASGSGRAIAGLDTALRAGARPSSKLRALSRRRPPWPADGLWLICTGTCTVEHPISDARGLALHDLWLPIWRV